MLMLAVTRRRRSATARDQAWYVDAEREACATLAASGSLRGLLRRVDGRGVVLLIEAPDSVEAKAILDGLPTIAMEASGYTAWVVEPFDVVSFASPNRSDNGARR